MQLKNVRRTRASLAAATLGLLGATPAPAAEAPEPAARSQPWEFDTALLLYSESDGRVQAAEPVIAAGKPLDGDRRVDFRLVLDSLTGASPNGAAPASTPQTFSAPSGGSHEYTAAPGEHPLDDSFRDTRVALSGEYTRPLGSSSRLGLGASMSKEYDFLSAGASARYSLDLNQHNTTLSAGLGVELDQVNPVGGTPVPLADIAGEPRQDSAQQDKRVVDVMVGVSQVLDPRSVVQFNYSIGSVSGYQTDPYKILSVVGADGEPVRYVYEERPDGRLRHAVYGRYKRSLWDRDVLDVSARAMTDDWGVKSLTFDSSYRWNFGETRYLEPHLRWYHQDAADFYRVALFDGEENSVTEASADPRLGTFDGVTLGLKYGQTLRSGNQWSARFEYYAQTPSATGVPAAAAAGLSKFDLEPGFSAVIATFGYRFKW